MSGESFTGPAMFMVKQMSGLWYWAKSACWCCTRRSRASSISSSETSFGMAILLYAA